VVKRDGWGQDGGGGGLNVLTSIWCQLGGGGGRGSPVGTV
jgi:hypothetical protein